MIRKTLLVISLVLLAGTMGLWVRSYWVNDTLAWRVDDREVGISSGGGGVSLGFWHHLPRTMPPGIYHFADDRSDGGGSLLSFFRVEKSTSPTGLFLMIIFPFWLPAAVLAGVSCWLARPLLRDLHRRRHDLCVGCGYDLRGNVSGVCPECGGPVGDRSPDADRCA